MDRTFQLPAISSQGVCTVGLCDLAKLTGPLLCWSQRSPPLLLGLPSMLDLLHPLLWLKHWLPCCTSFPPASSTCLEAPC